MNEYNGKTVNYIRCKQEITQSNLVWKDEAIGGGIQLEAGKEVPYLKFPLLEETGMVSHGFSTRLGGVSKNKFSTLNFGFLSGDESSAVLENYRRMGETLKMSPKRMVASYQTHTTNIRVVTEEDAGKGIVRERDYQDIDGLVTNVKNLPLVTFYADCVPLYFLDPEKSVIGLSHSGWRGTVGKIGAKTVGVMKETYDCNPEDIIAAIGPSICKDCYEVGREVAEAFKKSFTAEQVKEIITAKENEKYQLNLWQANMFVLLDAGITREHLAVTNICTGCNPDALFSHRASHGERGNLAAFMSLVH